MQISFETDKELVIPILKFKKRTTFSSLLDTGSASQFVKSYKAANAVLTGQGEIEDDGSLVSETSYSESTGNVSTRPESDEESTQKGCVEVKQIEFHLLREPATSSRVRDVNNERVKALATTLKTAKILPSALSVVVFGDEYEVIDGNHRFQAMKTIRNMAATEKTEKAPFQQVPCFVYEDLSMSDKLALGLEANARSQDVLKMTDFEHCYSIRRILDESSLEQSSEDQLQHVYKLLGGVYTVSFNALLYIEIPHRYRV